MFYRAMISQKKYNPAYLCLKEKCALQRPFKNNGMLRRIALSNKKTSRRRILTLFRKKKISR